MADDPPFDLSKFDPSTLDLSHLHPAEQNRIKARQYESWELSLLLQRQNPWTKSGKPKPLPTEDDRPDDSVFSKQPMVFPPSPPPSGPSGLGVDYPEWSQPESPPDSEPLELTATKKRKAPTDDGKSPIEGFLETQKNAPPESDEDRRLRKEEELQSRKESLQWRQEIEQRHRAWGDGTDIKGGGSHVNEHPPGGVESPRAKQTGLIAKFRAASKVGTIYISDWVVLGLIVAAALGFGGVALSERLYTLAEILFFFGIGLFIAKAIYDHRNHELKTHLMVFFIAVGGVAFLLLVGWVEWDRRHEKRLDGSSASASVPEVKQPSADARRDSIFGDQPYPPIPDNETYQHQRFRTECPDKNPIWSKYDLSGKEFKGTYQIETILCVQGEVRAVALYMFFPSDERTIPAINRMSDQYGAILLKFAGDGLVEYPPKRNPDRYKVTFAGRIFIYTEDDMSDEQAVSLSGIFSRKGAAMTIATPPDASGVIHAH